MWRVTKSSKLHYHRDLQDKPKKSHISTSLPQTMWLMASTTDIYLQTQKIDFCSSNFIFFSNKLAKRHCNHLSFQMLAQMRRYCFKLLASGLWETKIQNCHLSSSYSLSKICSKVPQKLTKFASGYPSALNLQFKHWFVFKVMYLHVYSTFQLFSVFIAIFALWIQLQACSDNNSP